LPDLARAMTPLLDLCEGDPRLKLALAAYHTIPNLVVIPYYNDDTIGEILWKIAQRKDDKKNLTPLILIIIFFINIKKEKNVALFKTLTLKKYKLLAAIIC